MCPNSGTKRTSEPNPTATERASNPYQRRSEGGYVFSIRQLDPENGRITGLTVEREGDREAVPDLHMVADEATWDSAGGWVLLRRPDPARRGLFLVVAGAAQLKTPLKVDVGVGANWDEAH